MRVKSGPLLRETRKSKKSEAYPHGLPLRVVALLIGSPNAYTFIGRLEREEVLTCSEPFARRLSEAYSVPLGLLFEANGSTSNGRSVRRGRIAA